MSKTIRNPIGITKFDLIALCDVFCRHKQVSDWRASAIVSQNNGRGDGKYFARLKAGGESVQSTYDRVWMRFHQVWPSDLDWPADIPRPDAETIASGASSLNTQRSIEKEGQQT